MLTKIKQNLVCFLPGKYRIEIRLNQFLFFAVFLSAIALLPSFLKNEDLTQHASLRIIDVRFGLLCGMKVPDSNDSVLWPPLGAFPAHRIFEYVNPKDLRILSKYIGRNGRGLPVIHKLHNVKLCTSLDVGHHSIAALIVDEDGMAIDISSKFLSSFAMSDGYYPIDVGPHLANCLTRARREIPSSELEGPFFFGFDTFIGMPAHHFEDLLHVIGSRDLNCLHDVPLLLPLFNNKYYDMSLALTRRFAGPVHQFLPGSVIRLKTLYVTQPYHSLTPPGRLFIDQVLVPNITSSFDDSVTSYEKIAILKLSSHSELQHSAGRSHKAGSAFFKMLEQEKIRLLDTSKMTQAEIIFYLNSANYVLLSWGATHLINYHMWISTAVRSHMNVVIICHPGYGIEYASLPISNINDSTRTRYAYAPGYDHNLPDFNYSFRGRAAKYILDVENLDTLSIADLQFNEQKAQSYSNCYSC